MPVYIASVGGLSFLCTCEMLGLRQGSRNLQTAGVLSIVFLLLD